MIMGQATKPQSFPFPGLHAFPAHPLELREHDLTSQSHDVGWKLECWYDLILSTTVEGFPQGGAKRFLGITVDWTLPLAPARHT